MIFNFIDWNSYNRPPYLPQWLSTGETKKFTSYDDGHLIEIEGQIYNISEQYDIEKAKSVLLDRIGRILSEPRNGNDDDLYRLFINLRKLLNTTNGTVNDIIKVIKFLYSSEVVKITPNYPAALTILHDGQGPDIDFNRILAQVIGAGIGYDTREIFVFKEELQSCDKLLITRGNKNLTDSFNEGGIKFDGEIIHDGTHTAGRRIRDRFALILRPGDFVDFFDTPIIHDGKIKANGFHKFNAGRVTDLPVRINGKLSSFEDNVVMDDPFKININLPLKFIDNFPTRYRFDGKFKHDGKITASGSSEEIRMTAKGLNTVDEHTTRLRHHGTIKADGTHKFNAVTGMGEFFRHFSAYKHKDSFNTTDSHAEKIKVTGLSDLIEAQEQPDINISLPVKDRAEMTEGFFIGLRRRYKHNGKYKANGKINFNSGILVPV